MIRFLFRFLATLALAVAVIFAVVDATRSVAAGRVVATPLAQSWAQGSPATMEAARTTVVTRASDRVWTVLVLPVLALPGFVIFAVLAFLLYALGHRPSRKRRGYRAAG